VSTIVIFTIKHQTYLAAHNKWYQSQVLATMAEGTRYVQLSETVATNKETFNQHMEMLKTLMEQVSLLTTTQSQNQIRMVGRVVVIRMGKTREKIVGILK
jgi:acetate kinase